MSCPAMNELIEGELFNELSHFSFITYYITISKLLFNMSY